MEDEALSIDQQFPGLPPTTGAPPFPPSDAPPPEPVFETIRLDDILGSAAVIQQKEADDAALFTALLTPNMSDLRSRVLTWGMAGFRGDCLLLEISLTPPPLCSDGVSRSLGDYITFVSGLSIGQHLEGLQLRLPDFRVAYVYSGGVIRFLASTA